MLAMFHKPLLRAQVRPIFCTRFFGRRIPSMTLGIRRLTSFRPDSVADCFQVPGTSFRFLLRFNLEGNIARVQPGSPETAQRRPQGSQEPGESPCAFRRLPERLPESSPGGVLKDTDPVESDSFANGEPETSFTGCRNPSAVRALP